MASCAGVKREVGEMKANSARAKYARLGRPQATPRETAAAVPAPAWLDDLRRGRGAWLDAAGFGAVEAPWREACRVEGMRLRAYGPPGPGPVLLLVPAPIKRAYIWDLAPARSVVRRALAAGFEVGLVEWTDPIGEDAAGLGLDDYADRLLGAALDALAALHDARGVLLGGHSLGGTLAAVFAALHPERVRGLVLVEAPLRFGPGAGRLGPLAAAAPWAPEATDAALGVVPGAVISALGVAADPVEFLTARWLDGLASAADPEAAATHARVMRWTLDELAMPGRLFAEVAGLLCRDDAFHRGTLTVAGRQAAAEGLAMPLLAVLDPHSRLVPPGSVLPSLAKAGGTATVLRHREEAAGIALGHVGALVGREAHRRLWPEILRWCCTVWGSGPGHGARPP